MTLKNVRGRVATGCLLATLLPLGPVLAQARIDPMLALCGTPRTRIIGAPPAAAGDPWAPSAPLVRVNDAPPWFRKTFYLFGTDGMCLVKPAIVAAGKDSRASASIAVAESLPPGTVKNLRRTDRR